MAPADAVKATHLLQCLLLMRNIILKRFIDIRHDAVQSLSIDNDNSLPELTPYEWLLMQVPCKANDLFFERYGRMMNDVLVQFQHHDMSDDDMKTLIKAIDTLCPTSAITCRNINYIFDECQVVTKQTTHFTLPDGDQDVPILSLLTRLVCLRFEASCVLSGTRITEFSTGHATSSIGKPGILRTSVVRRLPIVSEESSCDILLKFFKISRNDLLRNGILPGGRFVHGVLYARPRFTATLIRDILGRADYMPLDDIVDNHVCGLILSITDNLSTHVRDIVTIDDTFHSVLVQLACSMLFLNDKFLCPSEHVVNLLSSSVFDYNASDVFVGAQPSDGDDTYVNSKRPHRLYAVTVDEPLVMAAVIKYMINDGQSYVLKQFISSSLSIMRTLGSKTTAKGALFEIAVAGTLLNLSSDRTNIRDLIRYWCGDAAHDIPLPVWCTGSLNAQCILHDSGHLIVKMLDNVCHTDRTTMSFILLPVNTARPDVVMQVGSLMLLCGCKLYHKLPSSVADDNRASTDIRQLYCKGNESTNTEMYGECQSIIQAHGAPHTIRLVYNVSGEGPTSEYAAYEEVDGHVIVIFDRVSIKRFLRGDVSDVIEHFLTIDDD